MSDDATTHLAANVRAIREARGLSQQQIAKLAGVPRATWSHLESGAANPTLAVLTRVADALQVRLDELLARLSVPPGITGLWQVEARDNPSFSAYRRLDLFYVENWNLLLDLVLMMETCSSVAARVLRRGKKSRG